MSRAGIKANIMAMSIVKARLLFSVVLLASAIAALGLFLSHHPEGLGGASKSESLVIGLTLLEAAVGLVIVFRHDHHVRLVRAGALSLSAGLQTVSAFVMAMAIATYVGTNVTVAILLAIGQFCSTLVCAIGAATAPNTPSQYTTQYRALVTLLSTNVIVVLAVSWPSTAHRAAAVIVACVVLLLPVGALWATTGNWLSPERADLLWSLHRAALLAGLCVVWVAKTNVEIGLAWAWLWVVFGGAQLFLRLNRLEHMAFPLSSTASGDDIENGTSSPRNNTSPTMVNMANTGPAQEMDFRSAHVVDTSDVID
jgi:hypothetical protein